MSDENREKEQLIEELKTLRNRLANLERVEKSLQTKWSCS
jgi:hypothetical protein